ncbi:LytTR family DNA-binding domain-containing protein [Enterococcus hulanensis]|uniref:LytR/AlgR family response regulator transcription factor n=1 Tax=Enterococcus hulanensis TaxID=2559929 RepID=UPI002891D9E9|nr:LytTR family DNA-binding domain-containing protein [Enterococcus hulanensis]MDT2661135.1 LytTR family DNA-binding domain-containing protein [Enterococcus hulanensis]
MAIYILEDNVFQCGYLLKTISNICDTLGFKSIDIQESSRPERVIQFCNSSSYEKNLYFLDLKIDGDETAGFKVAQKIRSIEPQAMIVFVTSYANLALLSYEYMISAFAYILKYDDEKDYFDKITSCISAYKKSTETNSIDEYFIFENKFTSIRFLFNDLLYVTSVSPHKLVLCTKSKEIYCYGSLKDIQNLNNRIIRCHQSYLINIQNVKKIDKSNRRLILENEIHIPISKKMYATVSESWKKYYDLHNSINEINKLEK